MIDPIPELPRDPRLVTRGPTLRDRWRARRHTPSTQCDGIDKISHDRSDGALIIGTYRCELEQGHDGQHQGPLIGVTTAYDETLPEAPHD